MRKTRAMLARSADKGRHWRYVSTIAVDPATGTEGFGEPVIWALVPEELHRRRAALDADRFFADVMEKAAGEDASVLVVVDHEYGPRHCHLQRSRLAKERPLGECAVRHRRRLCERQVWHKHAWRCVIPVAQLSNLDVGEAGSRMG
jgi:hypothetical protein